MVAFNFPITLFVSQSVDLIWSQKHITTRLVFMWYLTKEESSIKRVHQIRCDFIWRWKQNRLLKRRVLNPLRRWTKSNESSLCLGIILVRQSLTVSNLHYLLQQGIIFREYLNKFLFKTIFLCRMNHIPLSTCQLWIGILVQSSLRRNYDLAKSVLAKRLVERIQVR